MTWFCGSRHKRRNKSKVSNVQYSSRDESAAAKNGKQFAIVLQNFEASVSDELSVSRGQIVEKLCTDSNWIYVRNVDGVCGYIPHSFCYGMDQVISGQHWTSDEGQGSRSETPPVRRHPPKSNRVNTAIAHSGSQSSVEVHNVEAPPTSPQQPNSSLSHPLRSSTPITTERQETPDSTPPLTRSNRRLSSLQPSAEHVAMETVDSAVVEEPRYVERPHGNISTVTTVATSSSNQNRLPPPRVPVRRSLSMNDSARSSCRPIPSGRQPRGDPIQRSISYQEAVRSAGQDPYGMVAGRNGRRPSESPLNQRRQQDGHVIPPQRLSPLNPRHQRGHMVHATGHYNCNCEGQSPDFDPTDDVFLPEPKKPVGIYRCLQTYKPKYQGELSVKEGELVILLEFGRGDWAWVLTSMNQEGLLPRQYLVRYNPRLGVGGPGQTARRKTSSSNASTQTELIVDGGCVRHVSGASSASTGATACSGSSSSSVATPLTTPPLSQRAKGRRRTTGTRMKEVAKGGEKSVASAAVQVVEGSTTSTQWFENVDSLERPPRPTKLNCSAQTTPPMKHKRHLSNIATPQSVKSADCYLDNRTPNPAALLTPNPIKSADYAGTANAEFWFNSLSSTASSVRVNPAPTLTAIRDYNPPTNAKNCLRLCKGDELSAQPHMHYPKGWMWVWHQTQRSFGYVPQSHVGYTYAIDKGQRSRKNTTEDAV